MDNNPSTSIDTINPKNAVNVSTVANEIINIIANRANFLGQLFNSFSYDSIQPFLFLMHKVFTSVCIHPPIVYPFPDFPYLRLTIEFTIFYSLGSILSSPFVSMIIFAIKSIYREFSSEISLYGICSNFFPSFHSATDVLNFLLMRF